MNNNFNSDTLCALATGGGISAIALLRISGDRSIEIVNKVFSKNLTKKESHTVHFGNIIIDNKIIDEVVITIFKKNQSFTGEETVEISCHGSKYIQNNFNNSYKITSKSSQNNFKNNPKIQKLTQKSSPAWTLDPMNLLLLHSKSESHSMLLMPCWPLSDDFLS